MGIQRIQVQPKKISVEFHSVRYYVSNMHKRARFSFKVNEVCSSIASSELDVHMHRPNDLWNPNTKMNV